MLPMLRRCVVSAFERLNYACSLLASFGNSFILVSLGFLIIISVSINSFWSIQSLLEWAALIASCSLNIMTILSQME